ncbi:prepilin peptidase [Brevirhabdus sp.]|uniref:prepilin peptidase n=1 Tax=Brevirhabdus sp. TaxID=2004514 RepID=UPI004057F311
MLATTSAQAAWLLPLTIPICIWVAWSDMKFMLIKNQAVLALMAVFLVAGLIAFPLDAYLWRWSHFAVVIAAGFVANAAGLIGAGDAKFAAAMAPFIARQDSALLFMIFASVLLGAFATHRLFRLVPAVRRMTPDWTSWDKQGDFPMGLALAGTLLIYLALSLLAGG